MPDLKHIRLVSGGPDLTIPYIRVFAGIGSKDAAERPAATSVHDWMAWKGAVQILLDLDVPVLSLTWCLLQVNLNFLIPVLLSEQTRRPGVDNLLFGKSAFLRLGTITGTYEANLKF